MKKTNHWLALMVVGLVASLRLFAHDTGPTVDLKIVGITDIASKTDVAKPDEGRRIALYLSLVDKNTKKALTDEDLSVVHEKKFHLMAFDAGLTNYLHEHPEHMAGKPGVWRVVVTFKQAGQYKLWADVTTVQHEHGAEDEHDHHHGGGNQVVMAQLSVGGVSTPNVEPKSLAVKLSGADGDSGIRLVNLEDPKSNTLPLVRDEMAMIGLEFSRANGTSNIQDYLGAKAHIVITNLKGTKSLHVHPMVHGGQLMIHTEFPEAGDYRLFVQFVDQHGSQVDASDLKTVELAVHVDSDFTNP